MDSRLRLSAAQKMGVDISEKAVKKKREEMVVEYLKNSRRSILGELSEKREKTDPRKDREYAKQLASLNTSVSLMQEQARRLIPESQVRVQMADEAIQDYYRKKAGPVTDKDVESSYDVYKVRQIMLRSGKLPEEQMKTRADNILKQAKSGKDFEQLVKDNSDGPMASRGGQTEYSLDRYVSTLQMAAQGFMMSPPELWPAVKKLKPGDISNAINTEMGTYIIKLENVESKKPEKLDKKAKKERRDQLQGVVDIQARMEFDKKMRKGAKIEVKDYEMAGYYYLSEARKARREGDEDLYKKRLRLASAELKKATKEQRNNPFAAVKYAEVLEEQGKDKMALQVLYPMLEGEAAPAQGADASIWLGDLFLKVKDEEGVEEGDTNKDKAIDQYQKASNAAIYDKSIHMQLKRKFEELGRQDLVQAEDKWIADFDKKQQDLRERAEAEKKEQEDKAGKKPTAPTPSAIPFPLPTGGN